MVSWAAPDGSWSEESVGIPGLDRDNAFALGRRFHQEAVCGVLAKVFSAHGSDRMLECPRHAWGPAGSTRITGQRRRWGLRWLLPMCQPPHDLQR